MLPLAWPRHASHSPAPCAGVRQSGYRAPRGPATYVPPAPPTPTPGTLPSQAAASRPQRRLRRRYAAAAPRHFWVPPLFEVWCRCVARLSSPRFASLPSSALPAISFGISASSPYCSASPSHGRCLVCNIESSPFVDTASSLSLATRAASGRPAFGRPAVG